MNWRVFWGCLGLVIFIAACTTIPSGPPRITYGGRYMEDRSAWEGFTRFKIHYAIDYYTAPKTPILAAANGTVEVIFDMDKILPEIWYGLWVTVGHGYYEEKILYAQYGHLGKLFVSVGDKVKRGQVLGLAAPTPERFKRIKTFEPHLHFALFQMKPGFRVGERRNFLIMKRRGDALITKTPFNPDDFWLGSKPQCFDPTKDYTQYKDFEFSHPVACGKSSGQ